MKVSVGRYGWILLGVIAAGCKPQPVASPVASSPTTATEAPTNDVVRLQTLDFEGIQKLIESKRGNVVVMDAWSTSCPPCMKEFPNLVALHGKYRDRVSCISLSFDYEGVGKPEDVAPKVLEFLKSQKATFDNILSSEASDLLYPKLKLVSVPAVFVYDREGKLAKRFDNESARSEAEGFTYEQVVETVENLLK